jgi:hypothetical protein
MVLKRRKFLEKTSWLLAALGISEAGWWQLSDRYSQVLAQPTGRKLALLVGINDYPEAPLKGCVTDVELQRQLLIYKYGFKQADILTLTNKEATRENIETAFVDRISSQAKPDDVVVFHFSGKGSSITTLAPGIESELASKAKVEKCLVTIDGVPPTKQKGKAPNDMLLETVWLLMRSLPTSKAIAVIDASYNYPGTDRQGNLRIRVRPAHATTQINLQEREMQSKLRQLGTTGGSKETQFPGLLLAASKDEQFASENDWSGFSCGLFTYALTQSLWEATPSTNLQVSFSRAGSFVEEISGLYQQPQLTKLPRVDATLLMANAASVLESGFFSPRAPAASGAIVSVEQSSKTASLWLAGLPQKVVELQATNSIFTTVPQANSSLPATLRIKSRSGLTAKAEILSASSSSSIAQSLVREKIRVLSKPINLTIALDEESLSRIERVDATSGFSAIPQVSVVAGNQPADYVFSRVRSRAIAQSPTAPLPSIYQGRYGLFSIGENLIPNTVGDEQEAAKTAVQRLSPRMRSLQAGKMLRATVNQGSSQLQVRATLATVTPESKVQVLRATVEADATDIKTGSDRHPSLGLVDIPIGSKIQFRLHNDGEKVLYFLFLAVDTDGRTLILDPSTSTTSNNPVQPLFQGQVIPPGQEIAVPPTIGDSLTPAGEFGWTTSGPEGLAEAYLIFCSQPFSKSTAALEGDMRLIRDNLPIKQVLSPFAVAQAVLEDLQNASKPGVQKAGISTDDWALDTGVWATLRFVYRLV